MREKINLINFINLDLELKKMILRWRNNQKIKKWMYTTQDITFENHLKFIESLKQKPDKLYFLVQSGNDYIGVIDFNDISKKSALMGIYKNPDLKGVGKLLLETLIKYAFKNLKVQTLYSEVFETNNSAYKLYESYGFKAFNSKIINNKKVICLELKNENR